MKTPGAVRHKLKQVRYRHRKKEIARRLDSKPSNCTHNGVVSLPDGGTVSVCLFKVGSEDWNNVVCDEAQGGLERAKQCPHFEPTSSAEEVKREFAEFLRTADRAEIAFHYPDVAALLWVLDEEGLPVVDDTPDDPLDASDGQSEWDTPPLEGEGRPTDEESVLEGGPLLAPRRMSTWAWIKSVLGLAP